MIELLSLGFRLDAELPPERADTLLVLPKCGRPPPEIGVEPHQRAMHRLLQGIERQQLERRAHGGLRGARLPLVREQLCQALKGKHALVTGGSRGIGRGIALKLAESGARVAIHYYVNESAARETLERVRKHGADGVLVQADVSKAEDVRRMFA